MECINMNVFKQLRDKKREQEAGLSKRSTSNAIAKTTKKSPVRTTDLVSKQAKPVAKIDKSGIGFGVQPKIVSNTVNKNNTLVTKYNTGDTIISGMVRDKQNPNNAELHQYRVKKQAAEEPNFDNLPIPTMNKKQPVDFEMKDMFVDTLKKNKLTQGTRIMMDNEVIHAKEAIESGIYVLWTSKSVNLL
jgi:hypothetical protein